MPLLPPSIKRVISSVKRMGNKLHLPQLKTVKGGIQAPAPPLTSPIDSTLIAESGSGIYPTEPIDPEPLRELVISTLRDIYDPEIPVNLYDLGLIYTIDISERAEVRIQMTLTAPACPVAGDIVNEVVTRIGELSAVAKCYTELVWDPPWSKERMSEEAQFELGLF